MTTDCKHAHIQTWRFEDSAEVAGLWSCTDCGRRFEPVAPVVDRVPLTDERVLDIAGDFKSQYMHGGTMFDEFDALGFVRAIEAAHGITAAKDKP